MKKALILGVTGQDGSYLAQLLITLGYEVHGVVRRSSSFNTERLRSLLLPDSKLDSSYVPGFHLHYGDITDAASLSDLFSRIKPDEIYNLAAQSHVRVSFDNPMYTAQTSGLGALACLEALRVYAPDARYYQASSSEMFGSTPPPQNESTPFHPRSPYGFSKVFAHWATINYRESYGLHATTGILFNHESPRRGETFVTRKVVKSALEVSLGLRQKVYLGNLEAERDWGYAPEYVGAMWKMLQMEKPGDFVVATGRVSSVQKFTQYVFQLLGLDYRQHIELDERLLRPAEVDSLIGDPAKAKLELGWSPEVFVEELADIMVEEEMKSIKSGLKYADRPKCWGVAL